MEENSTKVSDQLTSSEIAGVLNTAMCNGNFHTPYAREVQIEDNNRDFVSGEFLWGLHNGGTKRCHFYISFDGSIDIRDIEFDEKRMKFIPTKRHRIYNIPQLAKIFI